MVLHPSEDGKTILGAKTQIKRSSHFVPLHRLLGVAHRPGAEAAGEDTRRHHHQAL